MHPGDTQKMNDQNRDNLKIENSGTAFGVTNGDVTNDNRTMNGNNIVSGNQVNNALPERWIVAVICMTAIIALLILLCAFAFFCGYCRSVTAPVAVTNEIKIGPRGGVYYVDETGKRHYVDRERGMEIYREQQQSQEGGNE